MQILRLRRLLRSGRCAAVIGRLDRIGLDWAGWAGLGWAGLGWGWAGLGWAGLDWSGLGRLVGLAGLRCTALNRTCLDCDASHCTAIYAPPYARPSTVPERTAANSAEPKPNRAVRPNQGENKPTQCSLIGLSAHGKYAANQVDGRHHWGSLGYSQPYPDRAWTATDGRSTG